MQPDRVHRDLYLSEEIFRLEQEHFFANTWNYVGHGSQMPKPGDYLTVDDRRPPADHGAPAGRLRVKVLMNRCAHKGSRLVSQACGNTGKFFRCPYHAWTFRTDGALLNTPLKEGYDGTAMRECESGQGLVVVPHAARIPRLRVLPSSTTSAPASRSTSASRCPASTTWPTARPRASWRSPAACLRYLHNCNWKMFVENLNDTMHPMVAHESSAGTAMKMWMGKPADAPKPMAIEQFVPFMSDYEFFDGMGVRVFDNGHSFTGAKFSIHSKYSRRAGLRGSHGRGLWRAARARHPGR